MDGDIFTEGMMKGPDGEILRFFYDSERNEQATNAEGRAIFDTVLMCDIMTPGQKASTPRVEIERVWAPQSAKALGVIGPSKRSHHYKRFEEQVERFKRNENVDMGGTPLKMWPRADRGLIATLMAANIFTVEQLANISDASLDIVGMGARELRDQARAFLDTAAGTADSSALVAKASNLEIENQRLTEALALANNQAMALQKIIDAGKPAKLKDITLT
jgi:hypothetical protein